MLRRSTAHEGYKRCDIDDRTFALFDHVWDSVFGAEEGTFEIDIHDLIPGSLAYIGNTAILFWHNAGIIIENIHAAKGVDRCIDHVLDFVFVGVIGLNKSSPATI